MKIALVSNLYGSYRRGGAEVLVERIAHALRKQGHDVFVVSAAPYSDVGPAKVTAREDGVKVFRFFPWNIYFYSYAAFHPTWRRIVWTILDVFNFSAAYKVRRILYKEQPDRVFLHNLKGISYLVPRFLGKFKKRTILTLHDVQLVNPSGLMIWGQETKFINQWGEEVGPLNNSITVKVYMRICRFLFGSIKTVISPSRFLMDFYTNRKFFKKARQFVEPNPAVFQHQPDPRAIPSVTMMPSILNLLFVGQLEKHKGINWLVYFLRDSGFTFDSVQFVLNVAGDGSQSSVVKKTGDPINYLGRLDRERLKVVMFQSDYLIFPSLCYENSPSVIYEALSLGLPVIASKIGGVPELIKDSVNGLLFEPGERMSLKNALLRAYELRNSNYAKLSQAAQDSVAGYKMENYIKFLLSL